LRLLMNHGIPEDIRRLIEAKVWLSGSPPILSFHTYLEQVKTLLQRNVVQNDWKSVTDVLDGLVMQNVVL
jgi:hypothetical protein